MSLPILSEVLGPPQLALAPAERLLRRFQRGDLDAQARHPAVRQAVLGHQDPAAVGELLLDRVHRVVLAGDPRSAIHSSSRPSAKGKRPRAMPARRISSNRTPGTSMAAVSG